eukprot:scaffold869_cov105-Isochrysis_galbana.AAC.20
MAASRVARAIERVGRSCRMSCTCAKGSATRSAAGDGWGHREVRAVRRVGSAGGAAGRPPLGLGHRDGVDRWGWGSGAGKRLTAASQMGRTTAQSHPVDASRTMLHGMRSSMSCSCRASVRHDTPSHTPPPVSADVPPPPPAAASDGPQSEPEATAEASAGAGSVRAVAGARTRWTSSYWRRSLDEGAGGGCLVGNGTRKRHRRVTVRWAKLSAADWGGNGHSLKATASSCRGAERRAERSRAGGPHDPMPTGRRARAHPPELEEGDHIWPPLGYSDGVVAPERRDGAVQAEKVHLACARVRRKGRDA